MKLLKNIIIYLNILIALIITSCSSSTKQKTSLLPTITGKPGEVVIIINDSVWNTEVGESLKLIFNQDYPSLPQDEPIFTATHIPHSAFSSIFKTHRNLFFINIKPNLPSDSAHIFIKQDIWAKGQLIIECLAPNTTLASKLIKKNQNKIISIINVEERHRIQKAYKRNNNSQLSKYVFKKFNINIVIPIGYNLNIDTTNFIWISRETVELSQGLFIYSYPYKDTNDFSLTHIINTRNQFLKRYIKGPVVHSWMTTETRIGLHFQSFNYAGHYFSEVRGLWRVENDYMGGPFISLTTLSDDSTHLISVEGYVYAPKYRKREYLRQMESIIYTILETN